MQTKLFINKYLLTAFGVLMSVWISGVITCRSFELNQLVPQGEVYEYSKHNLTNSSATFIYDEQKKYFILNNAKAKKRFEKIKSSAEMRYIFMKISHLEQESIHVMLEYRDGQDSYRGCQSVELKNGQNWVLVSAPDFRYFTMYIKNQEGSSIAFEKIQVRELAPISRKLFFAIALICLLLYFFTLQKIRSICKTGKQKKRANNSIPFSIADEVYCLIKKRTISFFRKYPISRRNLRTGIFLAVFLSMYFANVSGTYMQNSYYKYYAAFVCICIFLLGTSSIGENRQDRQEEKVVTWSRLWICFCIVLCISDFWVTKFYKFSGWIFMIVLGFAFFCWKKGNARKYVLEDMFQALQILFWPCVIFCLFCRQKRGGVLYNGIYKDSKEFAVYALVMFVIFLSYFIRTCERNKEKKYVIWFWELGMALCGYFLLVSGELSCIVAGGCFGGYVLWRRREEVVKKYEIYFGLFFCILFVLLFHLSIRNVPQRLGTNVTFCSEELESWKSEDELERLKMIDPENYSRVKRKQDLELSNIWLTYLRQTSMLGSSKNGLFIHGRNRYPQNHIIDIMYRYGAIAVIFYVGILVLAAKKSFLLLRQEKWSDMELADAGCSFAFIVAGIFLELEKPFLLPVWIIFYFCLGNKVIFEDQIF